MLHALDNQRSLFDPWKGRQLAILLDYDGTLTPIVRRPEDAILSESMRTLLSRLAERCTLAIVSGRDRQDVQNMVRVPSLIYAGSHGFDIQGPAIHMEHDEAQKSLHDLDRSESILRQRLQPIPGCRVERKRFAIAIHYREVEDDQHVSQIEQIVDEIRDEFQTLRKMGGKKIFELQPDVPWNKGQAVLWITNALDLLRPEVALIYIGDDVTDEFAFEVLRSQESGVGILVGEPNERSHASYYLRNCDEVEQFLQQVYAGISS